MTRGLRETGRGRCVRAQDAPRFRVEVVGSIAQVVDKAHDVVPVSYQNISAWRVDVDGFTPEEGDGSGVIYVAFWERVSVDCR